MIRRLNESDRTACLDFLSEKPAENLFIIGDIENFGFEEEFQKLWGEFNEVGELSAVLLKYHRNYICYANHPFHAKGFAEIMIDDDEFMELSGLESITNAILPFIPQKKKKSRSLFYAKCDKMNSPDFKTDRSDIKEAVLGDIPRISQLHNTIDEFEVDDSRETGMRKSMENGSSRTFFKEVNHTVISSASTTAENSMSAMIVGVCTHPDYVQKGYASLCMITLCEKLLAEGKMLCLFYDNPKAGSIYKRLGFRDIGKWSMHIFEQRNNKKSVI